MDVELDFTLKAPDGTFWVISDVLLAGTKREEMCGKMVIMEENENSTLKEITKITNMICRRIERESNETKRHRRITYFYFGKESKSAFVTLCCVVRRFLKLLPLDAIRYIKTASRRRLPPTKDQIWLVEKYKPPIKVLFCGDRNTATCFQDVITFELKALPEDSIMIHGGCKGVDLFAEELAKGLGIATEAFGITSDEWCVLGKSAGPLRNRKMIDQGIDYVVAFHPDIELSKGTKDMMTQAWKAGIPVFIHDLKRKSKFEGDFSVL